MRYFLFLLLVLPVFAGDNSFPQTIGNPNTPTRIVGNPVTINGSAVGGGGAAAAFSILSSHRFIGAADTGNVNNGSRGIVTYGGASSQRIVAPMFFGGAFSQGIAQPEIDEVYIGGVPQLQLVSALFRTGGIEMTNRLILAISRDVRFSSYIKFSLTNGFTQGIQTVSNYYASIGITFNFEASELGEPTFFYDAASGTNFLGFSVCPATSQNNQTYWVAPSMSISNSAFGTPILSTPIAGHNYYDGHFYYDASNILNEELVIDGGYVANYTNSQNSLFSSSGWILTAARLAGIQGNSGLANDWLIERPNTKYIVSGTNGVYVKFGAFTCYTNQPTAVQTSISANWITWSFDNVNWAQPIPMNTVATNVGNYSDGVGGTYYAGNGYAIIPNGLRMTEIADWFDPLATSEMVTWGVQATNPTTIYGLSDFPAESFSTLNLPYASNTPSNLVTVPDLYARNFFVRWSDGSISAKAWDSDFYIAQNFTNMAKISGISEDGGGANGDMIFYYKNGSGFNPAGIILSDGSVRLGDTNHSFQGVGSLSLKGLFDPEGKTYQVGLIQMARIPPTVILTVNNLGYETNAISSDLNVSSSSGSPTISTSGTSQTVQIPTNALLTHGWTMQYIDGLLQPLVPY